MTREEKIIEIVNQTHRIEVNELAERLKVSKVTIRKDLDKLEERGFLHREHGYAVINSTHDINYRLASNYNLKKDIAKLAAEQIEDGEVLMIESGSTCTLLAEEIAKTKKDTTVITNSCFIAAYIRKYENVKILLLGGEYQKESQVNVGLLVGVMAKEFRVDKFFVGIDGFDEARGFTGTDVSRCSTARIMAESANKVIVMTDSSKFSNLGTVSEFAFEDIHSVYTDSGIDEKAHQFLVDHQIVIKMTK